MPDVPLIPAADLPALLHRYRHGEHLTDLAQAYGVSKQALTQRLDRYCLAGAADTTMHEAVTEYLVDRLCQAMESTSASQSALDIARAREACASWRWIAERRRPKLFGQKQQVELEERVTIIVNRHVDDDPPAQHIDITPHVTHAPSLGAGSPAPDAVETQQSE